MYIALPTETLNIIFLQLPARQLAVVSCVSLHFNAVAERIMYSNITLFDTLTIDSPRPERFLICYEALRRRMHLLDGVKRLQLKWQSNREESLPQGSLDSFCDLIHSLLPHLTHLEHLDLSLGPANILGGSNATISTRDSSSSHLHSIERAVRNCTFPFLQTCYLGADWIKGSRPYSSILSQFIESLPRLTHLKLADCKEFPDPQLRAGTLSSLATLRASPEVAAALLPGRSIRSLGLQGQDSEITRAVLTKMAMTAMPLQFLDLSGISIRPVTIRMIAEALPHVERLRVRLALRHTLHYALSGIRLLTGLSSVLKYFSSLVLLDLSPTTASGMAVATLGDEQALCSEWTRACSSLRQITFPSQTTWTWTTDGAWRLSSPSAYSSVSSTIVSPSSLSSTSVNCAPSSSLVPSSTSS